MPQAGQYGRLPQRAGDPAQAAAAVTPHDTTALVPPTGIPAADAARGLWVGTGGNVRVQPAGNPAATPVTFANVPDGTLLPVFVTHVLNAGTTASDILALY